MYVWMNQNGSAPLMIAAVNGRLPVVEYLVAKGADPTAQDNVNEQLNINLLFLTLT